MSLTHHILQKATRGGTSLSMAPHASGPVVRAWCAPGKAGGVLGKPGVLVFFLLCRCRLEERRRRKITVRSSIRLEPGVWLVLTTIPPHAAESNRLANCRKHATELASSPLVSHSVALWPPASNGTDCIGQPTQRCRKPRLTVCPAQHLTAPQALGVHHAL